MDTSYGRLKEREQELTQEIEALVKQASCCDKEEDQTYKDKTGYEIRDDLKFKQDRLEKIQEAKKVSVISLSDGLLFNLFDG